MRCLVDSRSRLTTPLRLLCSGMETTELSFLRDQVRRLNGALSIYQEKYPPLTEQEKAEANSCSGYLPQLVSDQSVLAPLLLEYDIENDALLQQVNVYKTEIDDLRLRVQNLIKENDRLHTELKATIEGQFEELGWNGEDNTGDGRLVENLQKEVASLKQEKEAALELWRTSSEKYEEINAKFREIRSAERAEISSYQALEEKAEQLLRKNSELAKTKQKLERANDHLQEIYTAHSQELADTREQLKVTRADKRAGEIRLTELEQGKQIAEEKLHNKNKEADQLKKESESLKSHLQAASSTLDNFREGMELLAQENEALVRATKELEDKNKALHWKCAEADRREFEAVNQVRESIQMVENALLEKDEAVIRERQKIQDIERMQTAMDKLVNEAGKRTRQEVDAIRKQCNKNIAKLMDEIQALENETGQRQAEIERLLREKRAVEEELEAVYREGSGALGDQRHLQMQDRLISVGRTLDETLMKMEGLEKEMKRKEMSYSDSQMQLTTKLQQTTKRMERLSQEAEILSQDKLRLTEELDILKMKQSETLKARDSAERKFNKQLSAVQREMLLLRAESEAKVDSIEESSRQSSKELRQMLVNHQKLSAKFKEEAKLLTSKYETRLAENSSELARLRKRSDDLSSQLSETRNIVLQAEQRLSQQLSANRKLSQSAAEHEQRSNELFMKLAEQGATEKRLLQEKKYLERELNRFREDRAPLRRSTITSARNSYIEGARLDQRPLAMNGQHQNIAGMRSSSLDSENSSADI